MVITEAERNALGVALNEADLLGVELDPVSRLAAATFRVLTLPSAGPPPDDRRVQFLFRPTSRIAASLRMGRWNDLAARVVPFELEKLLEVVREFGGLPIYGWEFLDVHDKTFNSWRDRLSLYWEAGEAGTSHSISLFQEGPESTLDLCLWFDELEIRDSAGVQKSVTEFCAGGQRWWDALYSGDPRAAGHGIVPMKRDG